MNQLSQNLRQLSGKVSVVSSDKSSIVCSAFPYSKEAASHFEKYVEFYKKIEISY